MTDQLAPLKGTLDLMVLRALVLAPMHGFEVLTWLEDRTGGSLGVDDSAIYQALYRMEKRGLVSVDWGTTENNRRARYYTLTPAGKAYLTAETSRWLRYSATLTSVLTG